MTTPGPILLINPSANETESARPASPPLSLACLAGAVHDLAPRAVLVEDIALRQNRAGSLGLAEGLSRLRRERPWLVGVSAVAGAEACTFGVLATAHAAGAVTVAGGLDATVHATEYASAADWVVLGEGELPFRELVLALSDGRTPDFRLGLYSRAAGVTVPCPPPPGTLDDLPLPARSLLPAPGLYQNGRGATIEESRGCSFHCTFCSIPRCGTGMRLKSLERIGQEVEDVLRISPERPFVRIISEGALMGRSRALAIAAILRDARLKWMVNAHPAVLLRRREELASMVAAGLVSVELGIESGSARVLDLLGKEVTPAENAAALELLKCAAVPRPRIEYIMFEPMMSLADLDEALAFVEAHQEHFLKDDRFPRHLFTELFPVPGTAACARLQAAGLLRVQRTGWPKPVFAPIFADPAVDAVRLRWSLLNSTSCTILPLERKLEILREARRTLDHVRRG